LIPLVTVIALSLPGFGSGAVVTETIFAWPGMGRLFINALGQFDFALLMGYMLLVSCLVITCNLLADICYAWLDPRVSTPSDVAADLPFTRVTDEPRAHRGDGADPQHGLAPLPSHKVALAASSSSPSWR